MFYALLYLGMFLSNSPSFSSTKLVCLLAVVLTLCIIVNRVGSRK